MKLELNPIDAAILRQLDYLSKYYEWVPYKRLRQRLQYNERIVKQRIKELLRKEWIKGIPHTGYGEWGFKITEKGLDRLALHDLYKNMVVKDLITPIGKGKEAEVWLGIDFDDNLIAVKKHLYDKAEFKKIAKSLSFAAIKWRAQQLGKKLYEINVPRAKAQIESKVLEMLYYRNFHVPKPISINRHIIVTQAIMENDYPAPRLVDLKEIPNAKELRDNILEEYERIKEKAKVVHGDLSAFNILLNKEGYWIIDWPQAVPLEYKEAEAMYKRDVENIKKFFEKKIKD